MFAPRTLRTLALLIVLYGMLVVPIYFSDSYAQSWAGLLVLVPALSIYVFNMAGMPGLLEHKGLCGWGWCAPTPMGWAVMVVFWLAVAWLLAWAISSLLGRLRGKNRSR